MQDAAKIADLVLLMINGRTGFEMETFEFLNMLQVHGFPKVMGILTHLDQIPKAKPLKKIKKTLKARFWVEVYQGAKLFYFSGLINGSYPHVELHNLALYISRMKFRPMPWRLTHPYVLCDRMEVCVALLLVTHSLCMCVCVCEAPWALCCGVLPRM